MDTAPIIVGVDFSPGSEAALVWAVEAAIAFDAPLIVLHVVHDPAEAPGYYQRGRGESQHDELQRLAQEMMDEFLSKARTKIERFDEIRQLEASVVVGLPVTRILEVAKRKGARLIAMGAQGRTALSDVLLGSKVERVTRLAPIPVAVVKTRPADEPASSTG